MKSEVFVAIDGNQIGCHIERLLFTGRLEELSDYSLRITASVRSFVKSIEGLGGKVVMAGGDNVLASMPRDGVEKFLSRIHFFATAELTFSTGIGDTPVEAYLALKYAKTEGGGIVTFANGRFAVGISEWGK